MIIKPTVTDLLTKVNNRFELVSITAKRARQISEAREKGNNQDKISAVTVAANEISKGKVAKC